MDVHEHQPHKEGLLGKFLKRETSQPICSTEIQTNICIRSPQICKLKCNMGTRGRGGGFSPGMEPGD